MSEFLDRMDRLRATEGGARAMEQERLILEVTETIWSAMEQAGVSKAELARRLGTSKSNVTQMLDGQRNLTLRKIADIFHAMGRRMTVDARPIDADAASGRVA